VSTLYLKHDCQNGMDVAGATANTAELTGAGKASTNRNTETSEAEREAKQVASSCYKQQKHKQQR
jgi:hypothetical protein